MKEITISSIDEGQRLDKYLAKLLPNAGKSFLYKMLRKKNIMLNGKKADGSEKIAAGDTIKVFFTDETFEKFHGHGVGSNVTKLDIQINSGGKSTEKRTSNGHIAENCTFNGLSTESKARDGYVTEKSVRNKFAESLKDTLNIVYEDENIIAVDKPSGMLSQKAKPDDISINELIVAYIMDEGKSETFKPGICNRLDRNTSGIVVSGKNMYGLQMLSKSFSERTIYKYYICIIKGVLDNRISLNGYLAKDCEKNKVTVISQDEYDRLDNKTRENYVNISTELIPYTPSEYDTATQTLYHTSHDVQTNLDETLSIVKIHLITGKPHQIRAHLASIGHPVAGDMKYGDEGFNKVLREKYGIKDQMLHAFQLILPNNVYTKADSDINIVTEFPEDFKRVLEGERLWERGIPEDLEALR